MPISPELMNTILVVLEVTLAIVGGFIAALWISLVIWTFRDIRSRSRDIFAQLLATLLVLILNLPGLILYILLRPPEKLSEAYERALEEEALLQDIEERALCPGCKRQVERDFVICPSCHTSLKKRCVECDRVIHLRWSICPYCAAHQDLTSRPSPSPTGHYSREDASSGARMEPPPVRATVTGREQMEQEALTYEAGTWEPLDQHAGFYREDGEQEEQSRS